MKLWILAVVAALMLVGASAQECQCDTVKWASCTGPPCQCTIPLTKDINQPLNCNALAPKCFLMKTEMLRRSKGRDTRTVGRPGEGFVDNDVIYDPECENDGKFKPKQCNNTEECWCVNSAGVRRTEKEGKDLICDKLVETYWIRLILEHAPLQGSVDKNLLKSALGDAIQARYKFDKSLVKEVEYDADAKKIQVDIKKPMNDTVIKLADMAYYMEREIKKTPMFVDQNKFAPMVGGQKLDFTNILVYYVDAEPPTFKVNRLAGGVIAAIVVVLLIVAAGLLLLFFWNRRNKKYRKTQVRHFLSVFLGL
ncbi:epithelial cell adhesion molecule-like [Oryzias latipes]|uniref:epithelial cell adhesion molecule-like n=1 Tax=Oryzias latipes TaxID=8090 RepID=UPI0005CBC18D|nr:epithelial cell adhesion molecule-like [Oryzias latipes]